MSHHQFITIKEASERIGVSIVSLHGKKDTKYSPFRRKVPSLKIALFDINSYEKQEDLRREMVEKVGLFIEYLNKDEFMSYSEMAEITGVNVQTIQQLSFGHKFAYQMLKAFANKRPYHVERFDKHYGYKTKPMKKRKVLA